MELIKAYIGIDPGESGCAACIDENKKFILWEWQGVKEARKIIHVWNTMFRLQMVVLEGVPFIPKGHIGAAKLNRNFGHWEGILQGSMIEYQVVFPQTWQKAFFGKKRKGVPKELKPDPKKISTEAARRFFPDYKHFLTRAKDHNRAEAMLLAFYAMGRGIKHQRSLI